MDPESDLIDINFDDADPSVAPAAGLAGAAPAVPPDQVDITLPSQIALPDRVVQERAHKADIAMGELSPGAASLTSSIQRGDEVYARETSATALALKERDNRLAMIQQLGAAKVPGSPVTQDEMDLIQGLSIEPTVDPRTVWENQFGHYLTNRLVFNTDSAAGAINQGLATDPNKTYDQLDIAKTYIAKNELVKGKVAEVEAKWKQAGIFETAGTFIEQLIPGKSGLNISGRSATELLSREGFKDVALKGNTILEQVQNLWAIPSAEGFIEQLHSTVDRIAETNLLDALEFVKAVQSYSTSDQTLTNIFSVLDAEGLVSLPGAVAVGVGKNIVRRVAGQAAEEARTAAARASVGASDAAYEQALKQFPPQTEAAKAITDAVRATAKYSEPERIASASGDTATATIMKAMQKQTSEVTAVVSDSVEDNYRGLLNTMPTVLRPWSIFDSAANLSNEAASRITSMLEFNAAKFLDDLESTVTPERLTAQALKQAVDNAVVELRGQFTHLNDSVLDVVRNPRDPITATDSVSMRLGNTDATPFDSSALAQTVARDLYELPDGAYTIGQQGTGFYIDIAKPVQETAESVRDFAVTTANKTPVPNLVKMVLQGIRSPAETLGALTRANRNAALLGHSTFLRNLETMSRPIAELSKKERSTLGRVMDINRDYFDPVTLQRGRYFDTASELEQSYLKNFGRLPSEKEVKAYYAAVQINEFDLVIRNAVAYRDKARAGLSNFSFRAGDSGYGEYGELQLIQSPRFEGRKTDFIPWGSDHLSVLYFDPRNKTMKVVGRNASTEDRELIEAALKSGGMEAIQVANPLARQFKHITGRNDPIQYVVTQGFEKSPLDVQQVGRAPGFHVEYSHGWYVKQPRLYTGEGGRRFYEGDTTVFSFSSKAQADKFSQRLETLKGLLKTGDEAALDRWLPKNLPGSKQFWKDQFDPKDGYLDTDNAFHAVANGRRVSDDINMDGIKDYTKGEYTLTDEMDRKFMGERSGPLRTVSESGTEEQPIFKFTNAPVLDSLSSTSRGIAQASRSRYFGDMKLQAAEQFAREFGHLTKHDPEVLRNSPTYVLHNPDWKPNLNAQERAAAEATQKAAMEFLGYKTTFGAQMDWMRTKLLNGVYKTVGSNVADLIDASKLMQSRDPIGFFRGIAFHAKLGLLNPVQVFVQSQTLGHITAVAPLQAPKALAASTFMRAMLLNGKDEIVEGASQKMKFLGWKPAEFKESFELMQRTGWQNVGREANVVDDMSDPSLYQSSVGQYLDKGAIFFNESEKLVRMTAWNAAYLQFRKTNPTKTIGNRELTEILSRADTLSVNMTTASKASWERGILSIPAQFQAYNVRLFEQMFGGQLTLAEKARVFTWNSAMYGMPVGVSTVVGYPLYEDMRAAAIDKGINVDNKWLEALVEGMPSAGLSALYGKDFNVAQRYGPGGFTLLKDAISGDKSWVELAIGPTGSTIKDVIKTAIPAVGALINMAIGEDYTPELNDVIDAARTVSSINSAYRVYAAQSVGKYVSRNNVYMSETNTPDAWMSAITGLQPREMTDAMIMGQDIKSVKEMQDAAGKEFQKYYSRGLQEAMLGNDDAADAYFKKANAFKEVGDFDAVSLSDLVKQALNSGNISMIERIKRDYWMKSPASKQGERLNRAAKSADALQNVPGAR